MNHTLVLGLLWGVRFGWVGFDEIQPYLHELRAQMGAKAYAAAVEAARDELC
jgi:hypothetical protein